MLERLLADVIVVAHLGFVLFVVLGGFVAVRWPRLAWIHLPCAAWGVWIALSGGVCPLTPLENTLRRAGGEAGYTTGFVEHYIIPALYPVGLTRTSQIALGVLVIAVNGVAYRLVWRRGTMRVRSGIGARRRGP